MPFPSPKLFLGLFCHGSHDSAVALLDGRGEILFASEQERYDRIKHSSRFPAEAITDALQETGARWDEIESIGFAWDPYADLHRIANFLLRQSFRAVPFLFYKKQNTESRLKKWLQMQNLEKNLRASGWRGSRLFRFHHHLCHAASSYYPSGFDDAICLTVDGNGEMASTMIHLASRSGIRPLFRTDFPHSLGHFYSTITQYLGFKPMNDEYKVMGLAAFRRKELNEEMRSKFRELLSFDSSGGYHLNLRYFRFQNGQNRMWGRDLEKLFGPAREPGGKILPSHEIVASLAQELLEEAMLGLSRKAKSLEPSATRLCLSGGVALNCVANERLTREGDWEEVFIPPSPHDSGTALGAAYLALMKSQPGLRPPKMHSASLGRAIGPDVAVPEGAWKAELPGKGLPARVAEILSEGKIVAWAQGRSEFGPRALGNRSILADPRLPGSKERLNLVIKKREAFRPFAPIVPIENAEEIFEMGGVPSPFMLRTVPTREEWRGRIPAAVHVDGTARVQTLRKEDNPALYSLILAFQKITGVPVLLNTSLNTSKEPIANSAADALEIFKSTSLDALVLGEYLLIKG